MILTSSFLVHSACYYLFYCSLRCQRRGYLSLWSKIVRCIRVLRKYCCSINCVLMIAVPAYFFCYVIHFASVASEYRRNFASLFSRFNGIVFPVLSLPVVYIMGPVEWFEEPDSTVNDILKTSLLIGDADCNSLVHLPFLSVFLNLLHFSINLC